MYLCYFDESGDSGYKNSPTKTFCLATIIIHESVWLDTLNQILSYRKFLKNNFNIPSRMELKAYWLINNEGPIKKLQLSKRARLNVFKSALRFQRNCNNFVTFAVAIKKKLITKRKRINPREEAWTRTIERLERYGSTLNGNTIMFPDEGHGYFIRAKLRKMRRSHLVKSAFNSASTLTRTADNIIEDPSDRKSSESYFIQFADLNAYAAHCAVYPSSNMNESVWELLGKARLKDVNKLSGGPTGIVVWPQK